MNKVVIKKKGTYTEDLPERFLALCSQGLSLTQISAELNIPKDQLKIWGKSERGAQQKFSIAFKRGEELCQAYHENLLRKMIHEGASGPVIEAQKYVLKVQFKADWTEKSEAKLEIHSTYDKMSTDDIKQQILAKARRTKLVPELKDFLNEKQKSIDQLSSTGDESTTH